ncbi:M48 family metalloprotease [Marinobacter salexigens]|uniref:M48 family metalloprotease n=1 Tax=Marinobacter salexigens TaxID=1925763 RepID=UPI00128FCE40|nr:M48 family metalloprotease [Marinobacter salexigens]
MRLHTRYSGVALIVVMGLTGCSSSPYQSEDWASDRELRQTEIKKLTAKAEQHSADNRDPLEDAVLLRSDSVSPLEATSVTAELQAIADELSNDWHGTPCRCQVRLGPRYSFGGFTYPNGTIVVQAGTLEYLDTRDEVAALLAHELSHLWLAHHQKNELQTGATGLVDLAQAISIFSHDDNARETTLRIGGSTDALVAAAGFTQWNREQETEADLLAAKVLEASRYSPMSMVALLTKLSKGKNDVPIAGSAYEEMGAAAANKLKNEETEVSDSQIQKWISSVASDMSGREYLSSEERRQIVRMVIYDLDGAALARSFSDMQINVDELKPVTSLKKIDNYEPTSPSYAELVDQALAYEPNNLHLQLVKFRTVLARKDWQQATQMARGFIQRPDATFSALSEATRFLDQHHEVTDSERKSLVYEAVLKLAKLDLPDAYVADQYYLSKRYEVPLHDMLNQKLCEAGTGKVNVRERCELAKQALESQRSFYQTLAEAGL